MQGARCSAAQLVAPDEREADSMAVPKRKKGRAKTNSRRACHDRLRSPALSECPQCHSQKLPHRVCPECGYYNGREVVEQS